MRTRLKLIILGVIGLVGFLNFVPVGNVVKAAEIDYPAKACEGLKRFDACAYNEGGEENIKNGYCVIGGDGAPHLFCKESKSISDLVAPFNIISGNNAKQYGTQCYEQALKISGEKRCIFLNNAEEFPNQPLKGVSRGICTNVPTKGFTCINDKSNENAIKTEWNGWTFNSKDSQSCSRTPIECPPSNPICGYTYGTSETNNSLRYDGFDAVCKPASANTCINPTCKSPQTCDAALMKCNSPGVSGVAGGGSGGTTTCGGTDCKMPPNVCVNVNGKDQCVASGTGGGSGQTKTCGKVSCKDPNICAKVKGVDACLPPGSTGTTGGNSTTSPTPDVIQTVSFQNPISANTLPELIATIIRGVLGLLGSIAVLLIAYAGFKYMTSLGNASETQTALKIITSAIIGLVIIMGSFLITEYIISSIK